jgi:hypothetical protein
MPSKPVSLRSILISPIYIWVFQVVSFLQVSPPKPSAYLFFLIHATCLAYLILLHLIAQIIFGKEEK